MKKLTMLLVMAVFAAPSFAQTKMDDSAGLNMAMDAFLAGWNNHNARSMAAAFAVDGDVIDSLGGSAKGRIDIEKFFAKEQASLTKNATATFQIYALRQLPDNLILADAYGTLSGITNPDGKTLPDMKNQVVIIFSRNRDTWQILSLRAYAFTSLPGVSEASPRVPAPAESPAPAKPPAQRGN